MAAEFKILVGADLDAAVKSINDFVKTTKNGFANVDGAIIASTNEFKRLQSLLSKTEDPRAISVYQKRLQDLAATLSTQIPPAAAKSAAALNNVNKTVGSSIPTLTNFGRVIQDAPFGIIGIANNIDPLISSFQALRASSTSTGAALKSLVAGLAGPAGIAIAVSAVTSALVAFGPQISAAIAGVDKFGLAQREAAAEGAEAFSKAFSEFTRLSGIINDSNAGVKRQEDAFKQLNSELAKYGLEIESITAFQKIGIEVGSIYAKIKQEEAKSTLFAAAAAEEYKQQIILQKKAQQGDLLGAFGDLKFADQLVVGAKTLTASTLAFAGGVGVLKTVFETSVAKGVGQTVKALADSEKDFNDEAAKSEKEITKLVNQLDKLDGVNEKTAKTTAKTTAAATGQAASIRQLNAAENESSVLLATELPKREANLTVQRATNLANEKAIALLREKNRLEALSPLGAGLARETFAAFDPTALQDNVNSQKNAKDEEARLLRIGQTAEFAAGQITDLFNQSFTAISQGESPIKAITNSLKGLIVRLAAAAAAAALLSALLPGGTAIGGVVAGGGKGFGALFGSLFGLAAGGIASRPTPALIGDGGAEAVIPLSQLANIIGGVAMQMGGGSGGGLSIVRGQDIYYSNNNASRSFGRLFG
jgi:hypothetical protein